MRLMLRCDLRLFQYHFSFGKFRFFVRFVYCLDGAFLVHKSQMGNLSPLIKEKKKNKKDKKYC